MATLSDRHAARQAKIKEVRDATMIPMVRVLPRDEIIRKHIAHMPGNIRFPKDGPARWPFDKFTKRRIADGDVTVATDEPAPESASAPELASAPEPSQ